MQLAEESSRRGYCFRSWTTRRIRTQAFSIGRSFVQLVDLHRAYLVLVVLISLSVNPCSADEGADASDHLNAKLETAGHETLVIEPLNESPYREGYVTLRWSEHPRTSLYRLVESNGTIYYEGPNTEAFLSGLEDGEYRFLVEALDSDGSVLLRSSFEEGLIVEHWSSKLVLTLLGTGGLVVSILALLIVWGSRLSSNSPEGTSVVSRDDSSSKERLSAPSLSQSGLSQSSHSQSGSLDADGDRETLP